MEFMLWSLKHEGSSTPLKLLLSFSLFFVFLIMLAKKTKKSKKKDRRRHYGPKMKPLIGCLIPFYKNRRRLLNWYTDMIAESPEMTIVVDRLGSRRTVVTANPGSVEHILRSNFRNYPKGKPFTDILGDLLGGGIFNSDGEHWRAQRRLASGEFTARSLRGFAARAESAVARLVMVLADAAAGAVVVDLQDLLRRLAFDTICELALGYDPAFLRPSLPDCDLAAAFESASAISALRGSAPVSAVWKAKRALGVGSERTLRDAVNLVHSRIASLISDRRSKMADRGGDLLSRLIDGGHTDEAIRDMAISFIMAGRDTTSAALTWFFWLVSSDRLVETELVKEVSATSPSYEELKGMKYLEASLCESMRLYPPVLWDSKFAAEDDILPDGTSVRRGDRVTYFPYGMGRMERLWGEDRMEFRPDRWLPEPAPDRVDDMAQRDDVARRVSAYKFAVFQAGPRVCLGKELAFLQMKHVAAAVLRRFELRRVDEAAPAPEVVPLLTAHMAGGLKMIVKERSNGLSH